MPSSVKRGATRERGEFGSASASNGRRSYLKLAGFAAFALVLATALELLSRGASLRPARTTDEHQQQILARQQLTGLQRRFASVLKKAADATKVDVAEEASAVVTLPRHANEPFRLADRSSGLALEARLKNAPVTTGESVDGYVVYASAAA